MFDLEKTGDGRYEVYLVDPRTRLGLVLGKAGDWRAENRNGRQIQGAFGTRKDAAKALWMHWSMHH